MSTAEAIEATPNPESTPTAELESTDQAREEQGHEGHDHAAHDPSHGPAGPVLNPACVREVDIEVAADEVSKTYRTIIKRYQKQARIPGFRSGKIPDSLIRSKFADSIRQDVIEALLPEHFRKAIEAQELKPVSQPQVIQLRVEDGEPLQCKAAFEVVPPFSLEGYDQVHVEKVDSQLTDAEYEAELERLRESRATMEPVAEDRGLADGDFASISFKGHFQHAASGEEQAPNNQVPSDQVLADGSPEDQSAGGQPQAEPITGDDVILEVGGKNTLESFNDALRGSKPGQELKFEVTYPQDFNEQRLAGKTVAYDVEVKGIKRRLMPELNDDFAKELGEYETIAEFTEKFREHMANDKRRRTEAEAKDKLLQALIARFDFPVPESLVQQQVDARLDRGLRALAQQGMRPEDMRKLDFDRLRVAQHDSALAEVKGSIILDHIAESESIHVNDEEIEHELQVIALQTREPIETLRARLTEDGSVAKIREQLRREKTGSALYQRLAS